MSRIRFPNESREYRDAREKLLAAETELRDRVAEVAALRRELPPGGSVPEDYALTELADGHERTVRLSELFGEHDTLFLYGYMFGPAMDEPCPMCTSILDGLEGNAPQIGERIALAAVAGAPIRRLVEFAARRGWRHLRLVSSAGTTFGRDYFAESEAGDPMPMANVFVRKDGVVRHSWGTEVLYAETDGDPCHMDLMWPLWNVLDTTPAGRGDWYPSLWPPTRQS